MLIDAGHVKHLLILLVEDNPGDALLVSELLKSSMNNFDIRKTALLSEAIKLTGEHAFDVILLDLGLPDSVGIETLRKIQSLKLKAPVVVMTGMDDEETALTSVREGAQDYLVKQNLTADNILRAIRYGIERKKLFEEVTASRIALEQLNADLDLRVRIRTMELEKYATSLKDLNAMKDKFFGIIAHDLRNPFSGLIGASELLVSYANEFDRENIRNISISLNDSAKQGYALLENLLEWSRSQTGKIEFDVQKWNLRSLLDGNISNVRSQAISKGIQLHCEVADDLEIMADANMINTVMRNLLSNAIKFTPKGGNITIHAELSQDHMTIGVKDSGIGISRENIARLFRLDDKYTREGTEHESGTGLGLMLCKEFVEKHGGTIWVESIEGNGSEFIFTIPSS